MEAQTRIEVCSKCQKAPALCICSMIKPLNNRLPVLILQHPQEPDKELGTARIANLALENSLLKVGLSWQNLAKALGEPVSGLASEWLVLFLGTKSNNQKLPEKVQEDTVVVFNKKGEIHAEQAEVLRTIRGIVVLDGNWSQAKTMWWRNPWLLKLRRGIVIPRSKSLYGSLRKEPRSECLSTIEAIGATLTGLGENPLIQEELNKLFAALLQKVRENSGTKTPQSL